MKNRLLSIGAAIALISGVTVQAASPVRPDFSTYVSGVSARVHSADRQWRNASFLSPTKTLKAAPQVDKTVGPMSYWGSVYTPAGEEWLYSCDYTYDYFFNEEWGTQSPTITSAHITLYDADFKVYKAFDADFSLGEHETSINSIQVAPLLTKKFFNINDAYEVMVYVHATTDDYTGHSYTQVYTLSDGSYITTIEGDNIASVNTATDSWSENYTLVFMREQTTITEEEYSYHLIFDIYSKAGWSTGCTLEHTFDVDYALIAGAGNYALPMLVSKKGNDVCYVLPSYEKPYFVSDLSDEITPDNHFVLDLYDSSFNLVRSTQIPMGIEGDAIFSFPGIGELNGFDDVSFDEYGQPVYVVGVENYYPSRDDFITSMYVYDANGVRTATIFENADDYLALADVPGFPQQYCIYYADDNYGHFSFVDVPSGIERAVIPVTIDDSFISTSLDRVPYKGSYQYVSSLSQGFVDFDGNVIHKFAWYDADGSFAHYDSINLGKDVVMALPYVATEALDPYLFDTSDNYEYMFLVKEMLNDGTSRSKECLRIYSDDSNCLLNIEPIAETGEVLSSIFLSNPQSAKPTLVVTYSGDEGYTWRTYRLPLVSDTHGSGTPDDPYLISNAGEFRTIQQTPSAYYELVDDIDFNGVAWSGNRCAFSGHLQGNGHTIRNLNLSGSGMFASIANGGSISDICIEGVNMTANGLSGIIAGSLVGGDASGSSLSGIHIKDVVVTTADGMDFGGLVGEINLHSSISDCSVSRAVISGDRYCSVGGLVGHASTGAKITNGLFEGSISASVAGGILAESSLGDEEITNCHVYADVTANSVAGGIVGYSSRSSISHCFVDGTVTAVGDRRVCAGGIVGELKANYADEHPVIVQHNIVAAAVSASGNDSNAVAHRIVGFTSGDDMLVDWESTDPNVDWSDPSTYPYVPGDPEISIANNYAVGSAVVDASAPDSADSVEGKTIALADVTADWLTANQWALGDNAAAPWRLGGNVLLLYYETLAIHALSDIVSVSPTDESPAIVTFVCDNRYADKIEVTCSDSDVAAILSQTVSDDGFSVVCEIAYVGDGECQIVASLGQTQAVCTIVASVAGIDDTIITSNPLAFDGVNLSCANEQIYVYNIAGVCVASGRSEVSVASLPAGIYIAVAADSTLKFRK